MAPKPNPQLPERRGPSELESARELQRVRKAAGGDREAQGKLLRSVAPAMTGAIRRVLGRSSIEMEDVLQESCMALLAALPKFRGDSTLKRYGCAIAVRSALSARRRRRDAMANVIQLHQSNDRVAPPSPHDELQEQELFQLLLDEVPQEQAEALVMRAVLGHSLPEIAAASGVPLNTVRSRIRLARELLRRKLEKRWGRRVRGNT